MVDLYLVSENNDLVHVVGPAWADETKVSRTTTVREENDFRNFFGATVRYKKPPESSPVFSL